MQLTASKLYNYLQCPHRVWRDAYGPQAEKIKETNPFVQLLWDKGVQHEQKAVSRLGDFVDLSRQIIIEVDGSIHTLPEIMEKDSTREAKLKKAGWYVIRLQTSDSNEDWFETLRDQIPKALKSFNKRCKEKNVDTKEVDYPTEVALADKF